jgi:type III secretion system (T3SS) inner membrane Yop/YscD-like protein
MREPLQILSLGVLAAVFAAPVAARDPKIERVAWLADGRILALVDGAGRSLSSSGLELYHDGERVEPLRLDPDTDGYYRLAYHAPRSLGPRVHHEIVLAGGGLERTRPLTAEIVEGVELATAGLDTWGAERVELSFLERSAAVLAAALGLISLYALYRWQKERRAPPRRVCKNCGETIEPGFKICVYCTYPDLLAARKQAKAEESARRAAGIPPSLEETTVLERVPTLQIVEGAQAGRRFPLRAEQVFIGRSSTLDVVLPDPRVAPRHARLVHKTRNYRFEDLSGLGLKLNGRPLRSGKIGFGDRLTLGGTTLLLLPD